MRSLVLGFGIVLASAHCPLSPVGRGIPFPRASADVPFSVHTPQSILTRRFDGSKCLFGRDAFGGSPYAIAVDWPRRELLISAAVEKPNRYEFWRWSPASGALARESVREEGHGLRGFAAWSGEVAWLDKPPDLKGDDCVVRLAGKASPSIVALCHGGIALNEHALFFSHEKALMQFDRGTGEVREVAPGSRPAVAPDGRLAFFDPEGNIEVRGIDGTQSLVDTKSALKLRSLPMDTRPTLSWSGNGSLVVTILQRGNAEHEICKGFPCFESYLLGEQGATFLTSGIISGSPVVFSPQELINCPAGTEKAAASSDPIH